jgi:hypothetical protein
MHDPHRQASGHVRVVLCVICLLTLCAPFRVPVNSRAYIEASAQEVVLACLEPHSPAFALPPSGPHFSSAPHRVPEMPANASPRPVHTLHVDLQVPEMLLQTLLREEMTRGSTKLPGPEMVLTTLFAEGEVRKLSGIQRQYDSALRQ